MAGDKAGKKEQGKQGKQTENRRPSSASQSSLSPTAASFTLTGAAASSTSTSTFQTVATPRFTSPGRTPRARSNGRATPTVTSLDVAPVEGEQDKGESVTSKWPTSVNLTSRLDQRHYTSTCALPRAGDCRGHLSVAFVLSRIVIVANIALKMSITPASSFFVHSPALALP